jgi:hypothetical protein
MAENENGAQGEFRTERATLMVTPDEKRAIRLVAAARDITESELLRETVLADIIAAYTRIQARLPKVA